ncbi:hypothetical protein GCM10025789_26220 [Tessaracoccus lubricantis]|uniref:Uncharacterized protein n=1 Tax=Tessaracoccus lubricantis TaxID=545543 RepID=A0ABP9FJN9_9ACTN
MTAEDFDDDMLAPPIDGVAGGIGGVDDHDGHTDEWHPSHGFTDARMAVRVWVDEESRHVAKVHVSPRWREVLGANRSLEDAFQEAFFAASVRVDDGSSLIPDVLPEATPDPDSTLTWADLEAVQERVLVLTERQEALSSRPDDQIRWAHLEGEQTLARRGPVTVALSWSGLAESVRFERNWLLSATSEQIEAGVLSTCRSAHANYSPPVFVPGEHEELAEEFHRAQRDLLTIMAKDI